MRTIRGVVWAAGVVVVAACGGGGDVTAPPPVSADLTCVNPATAGAAVTCSLTLPEEVANIKATIAGHETCEAHGDVFTITAPVSGSLTTDGCFDTVGKEFDLGGPHATGTVLTAEFTPGMLVTGSPGLAAVQVTGEYPQWTINIEDAVAAFPGEPDDYDDLIVTVTVTR